MTAVSLELFRRGHLPVMGEWFALPLIDEARRLGDDAGGADEEIFHPVAERILARCDACLRIGGPSEGADRMVAIARRARQDRLPRHRGGPVTRARRLQQVRDDDRRGRPRARRAARLLRRGRPAEHRGQPRQADGRARPRARLRGRRLRGAAGPPAAVDRRPDDRHRRDRGRVDARAVRLLPPARAHRRRLPRARPRSTGSATSTRRSSVRTTIRRPGCPARAARARSRSTPARCS